MFLPPIVDRELRVAARRKTTFRARSFAAAAAIVVWIALFLMLSLVEKNAAKNELTREFRLLAAGLLGRRAPDASTGSATSENRRLMDRESLLG